ncbi:MAG: DUF2059 domain-containing protein [Candidatus Omnitrophica bacterium]|nr:DUF2059 domain-containing protein [Candidatus Omnitrophota bacterium]
MMKMMIKMMVLVMMLMSFASQSFAVEPGSKISQLLDFSGLTMQIEGFPETIKMGISQGSQKFEQPSDSDSLLTMVDQSIDTKAMLNGVAQDLVKDLSAADIDQLLTWYQTDVARRITKAEEAASTAGAFQEMLEMAESLLANTKRVEVAKQFDRLLNTTEFAMNIHKNTQLAVISSVSKTMNRSEQLDLTMLKSQMDKHEDQMKASIQQMLIVSFVYTYRDISDEDLDAYFSFLGKPLTKQFNQIVMSGLDREMEKAVKTLFDNIAFKFSDQAK